MDRLKKFLSIVILLVLSMNVMAQTSIGFRGGINVGNVSEPDIIGQILPDFQSIIGSNVAVVVEIGISDHFSFQPELAFTQKGFKLKEGIDINLFKIPLPLGVKATTKVNYVEIPLLAKVKFGNEKMQTYLTAGPVLSYAVGGRFKTQAQILFDIPIIDQKLDLDALGYNQFEIGVSVGGGLSFNTGQGAFFVDARYTHGFTDVYDVPVVDLKLKNKGFGVNVGYLIPITSNKTSRKNSRILYP